MKIKINNPKYFILPVIICVLVFSGAICGGQETTTTEEETTTETTPTTTTTDLSTVDPTTISSTFTTNFNLAKQKASEWKKDSKLYNVSIKLPIDLSLNNATETYVFGSPETAEFWWVYSLSEASNKSLRALIYKSDYLGNTLAAIDESFWKTNYLQAFQIADKYQGATFRQSNPNTAVTISLYRGEPKGWLWWIVEYKATNGQTIKVRVNPSDLTIVDDLGNIVSTTAPSTSTSGTTDTTGTTTPSTTQGTGTSGTTTTPSTTPGTSTTPTTP